jgi:hypothetical protein
MAKISWNPKSRAKGQKPSPIAWGCYVYMREDGSFETEFKGETGFLMMKAAVDVLHTIDRLRREPAYDFGNPTYREFDPPSSS